MEFSHDFKVIIFGTFSGMLFSYILIQDDPIDAEYNKKGGLFYMG